MLDLNENYLETFESISAAVRYLKSKGVHAKDSNIGDVCKCRGNIAYGHKWSYASWKGVSTIPKGSSPVIDTPDEAHNDQNGRKDSQVA